MAQGLYYLLTLIAIGVVIRWFVKNDGVKPGEPTMGILRMDGHATPKDGKARRAFRLLPRRALRPGRSRHP